MEKGTVWVVKEQHTRHESGTNVMDYTPALVFGDLQFITKFDMPMHPRSPSQENWDQDVQRFVRLYNPFRDYIITTGQPAAIFMIGWLLGVVKKGPRFLVWRREEGRYLPVVFLAD